jgi:hypothetical protein
MVLKRTRDLSFEIALRESETETIFGLSPYTVSLYCVIIIPYVTLLRYAQLRHQYVF